MKRITQVILCGLVATTIFAQGFGLPPGKWWKMPRVVQMLEQTQPQQEGLDEVFGNAAPELIDLKAELEKATVAVRGAVDLAEIDRDDVRTAVSRVNVARAKMFERELMLLLDMREVLTTQQWSRLRQALDERRSDTRRPDRRPPRPTATVGVGVVRPRATRDGVPAVARDPTSTWTLHRFQFSIFNFQFHNGRS